MAVSGFSSGAASADLYMYVGGGPSGHPRVFINVDKPEVIPCGYCGLPFAHVKNREHLEQHGASYPLE